MATDDKKENPCMQAEPQPEHLWLQQLIGEWTFEVEAQPEPGRPLEKFTGSESVRSLGGLWILAEGKGEMPGGGAATMILTLGYDPQKKRYVGTWVGSMMTHLWVYEGALDADGRILTLDTEGPDMSVEGKVAKYRDVYELKSADQRSLASNILADDGTWQVMMKASYQRK